MLSFTLVLSAVLYAHHTSAVTTVFIPGFDPQPVTANLIGSQGGVATYVIAPGVSSGGLDDYGFDGPATVVAGPSTAALTYIDEDLGLALYENCNVANGIAVCEDVVIEMGSEGGTVTETITQAVEYLTVQGGGANSITTSPVPTGDFATWSDTYGYLTSSDDDSATADADSTQQSVAAPTSTGFSKVVTPTGGASQAGSSTTSSSDAQTTGKTSGAAQFKISSIATVVVAGLVGIFVTSEFSSLGFAS
ncbi:hypothetical protein C8Q72DRAFT_517429 [Fomitopsis betulina]|nr:hypothetical protein C8Q72DRAFT_517429 [Fomitopsis betulina]